MSSNISREQHWRIFEVILVLIFASCLIGLLQFSGAQFRHPLINYLDGSVSGTFANRNHFALFVALGCLIAPTWGFRRDRKSRWKTIISVALLPFFLLSLLASGSRAGLLLGGLGLVIGLFTVRATVIREVRAMPRWAAITSVLSTMAVLGSAVILSFALGRAVAVERAFDLQIADDLRSRALPYVMEAIVRYFPVGTGFGTFDPAYRIIEPDALLQTVYFNHAHNDWLEVVLEGGVFGAALALGVVAWVMRTALLVWRKREESTRLGQVAPMVLLLIALASIPDYPVRTPMIMAVAMLAACWMHLAASSTPARAAGPNFT